jgi:hypothetical protein
VGFRARNKTKKSITKIALSSDEHAYSVGSIIMTGETRRFRRKPCLGANLSTADPARTTLGSSAALPPP